MGKVLDYVMREAKTFYDGRKLVTGINCPAETAYTNMMLTKILHKKTTGRMYYHLCQSFSPDEDITPETAHKIGVKLAEKLFPGYEVVVGTHVDRAHIHSHLVFNSVSCETGKMYHSNKYDIQRWRDTSDDICMKYGLSVLKNTTKHQIQRIGTREYRAATKAQSWKINLMVQIEHAMKKAKTKKEFRQIMQEKGYQITWTDSRKNITYTTPEGKKCRDDRLHETKFLKEMMEYEFRIRAGLIGNQETRYAETRPGSQADSLCSDNRSKLESASGSDKRTDEDGTGKCGRIEKDGTGGFVSRLSQSDIRIKRELSQEMAERSGISGVGMEDGSGRTGWEYEREICFGTSTIEERVTGRDEVLYQEDLSPIIDTDRSFSDLIDIAHLASDIGNMIDSDENFPPDSTSKPEHMDKKEWEKIVEKNKAHGIKMGGI